MELYGWDQSGSQQVRSPEWSSGDGETGLEESMWQLALNSSESYPDRPGVPVCVYYMRTGSCGFGSKCRYDHPRDRAAVAAAVRVTGEYPKRPGESVCQYYLRTGTCKFGASCKFHHPTRGGGPMTSQVPLSINGYPLRPGEKQCSYYLKTGQCKFGITCKYHHPQPAGTPLPASAPQFYPQVQSPSFPLAEQYGGAGAATHLRVARPPVLHGSYVQGAYGPVLLPPGVVSFPGYSPYSVPISPLPSPGAQPAAGGSSVYGVTPMPPTLGGSYTSFSASVGPSSSNQKDQLFPERPGEPECQYFLKTGDCKFGSSCRYHHPWDRVMPRTSYILSPLGLPLRPGTQPCTFYLQNGHCKFGSTCKFDHPMGTMRYSPSASSLVDVPIAIPPYPVGSLLAPSPSSSDLHPEQLMMLGPNPDSYSSGSVGLIFPHTGPVSLSDVQLSGLEHEARQ